MEILDKLIENLKIHGDNVIILLIMGILLLIALWILVKLIAFILETLFVSSFLLVMCFVALFFILGLLLFVLGVSTALLKLWTTNEILAIIGCIVFGLLSCLISGCVGYTFLKRIQELENQSTDIKKRQ